MMYLHLHGFRDAWKEDVHPRAPAGTSKAGQFVAKGGGSGAHLLHKAPDQPKEKKKDTKKEVAAQAESPKAKRPSNSKLPESHYKAELERQRTRAQLKKNTTFGTWSGTEEQLKQYAHDLVHLTSKALGFDPGRVDVLDTVKKFTLNGKEYVSGGTSDAKTGRITLYQDSMGPGTDGALAHEIGHQKFDLMLRLLQDEAKAVKNDVPADEKPDPEKYPVYAKLHPLLIGNFEKLAKNADIGSDYSALYWKAWKKKEATLHLAMSEHLAEMTRLHWLTGKVPGTKAWQDLYWAVTDLYPEHKHKGPGGTEEPRQFATPATKARFKPAESHSDKQARKQADDEKYAREKFITDGPNEGFSRAGIIKGPHIGYWGGSHRGSSIITGYSAKVMGIGGYKDAGATRESERVGDTMLEAIRDSYGSSEKLYHAFENTRKIEWKVGDTFRLPLTATAGRPETSYAIHYSREDEDNTDATVFEFPVGTRYAGYSRWDRRESEDFGHQWAEAVVAGGFKVTGTRTEHEDGYKHLPYTVVTLEPTEYYDPYEDEWKPIDD